MLWYGIALSSSDSSVENDTSTPFTSACVQRFSCLGFQGERCRSIYCRSGLGSARRAAARTTYCSASSWPNLIRENARRAALQEDEAAGGEKPHDGEALCGEQEGAMPAPLRAHAAQRSRVQHARARAHATGRSTAAGRGQCALGTSTFFQKFLALSRQEFAL
jgi:hypothetical protein